MDTDAVRFEAAQHRVAWSVELFCQVIGLADKDLVMNDLVHVVGGAVRDEINGADLLEQRCDRLNEKAVFLPRFPYK